MILLAALITTAAVVTVIVVFALERIVPDAPHPDIARIEWPVAPDPSIVVERRKHE